MFRLDNLLERWTEIYAPMQHNPSATAKPEEKAFFLIDRWADQNEFQRTFNLLHKPSLCYCTTIEAQIAPKANPKQIIYQYNWYLACKQRSTGNPLADDEGARNAKLDLNDMMIDLLAFLFTLKGYVRGRTLPKDCPDAVRDIADSLSAEDRQGIDGLRLDETQWWSAPVYKNGWWLLGVELEGLDPRQLCIVPTRYI